MKYVLSLLILITLIIPVLADEKSLAFDQNILRYYYDKSTNLLYLACGDVKEEPSVEIKNIAIRIIDIASLSEIKKIQIDGFPADISSCDNGKNILIAFTDLSRGGMTTGHKGSLVKMDRGTGKTVNKINFDKSPDMMVVDSAQKYSYMRIEGSNDESYSKKKNLAEANLICKIDLDRFVITADTPLKGRWSLNLVITPDDKKIFHDVYRGQLRDEDDTYMLCAYRTEDLSLINAMPIPYGFPSMALAKDGRLFLSISEDIPRSIPTLYVIDSNSCEIIDSRHFGIINFTELTYDSASNKLYCATSQPVENKEDYGPKHFLEPSGKLMIVNLDDYSSETVTLHDKPIVFLSAIPFNGKTCLTYLTTEPMQLNLIEYPVGK